MSERVYQEIDDMVTRWDYASTTIRYQGHASPGTATSAARWRIKRFTFDSQGRHTATEFAGGSGEYNQIWDDRASLSFS
mgnify:CR=1 FL=1